MFLIKCSNCSWSEKNTGSHKELTHLREIRRSCDKCGKPRVFACPKCSHRAVMKRLP